MTLSEELSQTFFNPVEKHHKSRTISCPAFIIHEPRLFEAVEKPDVVGRGFQFTILDFMNKLDDSIIVGSG